MWVFTSRIWRSLGELPADVAQAGAYAMPLLALTAVGMGFYARFDRTRRHETITGQGHRARLVPLGRWRVPCAVLALLAVTAVAALPLLSLVLGLDPALLRRTLAGRAGTARRRRLRRDADRRTDAVRARELRCPRRRGRHDRRRHRRGRSLARPEDARPGRRLLDGLAFLPIAVPGVVLGVALLAVYLRSPLPVYGTLWILLIAYVSRFLPYGMRAVRFRWDKSGASSRSRLTSAAPAGGRRSAVSCSPCSPPDWWPGGSRWRSCRCESSSSSILLYSPGNEVLAVQFWELYEGGEFQDLAALGVVTTLGLGALAAVAYVWCAARRQPVR